MCGKEQPRSTSKCLLLCSMEEKKPFLYKIPYRMNGDECDVHCVLCWLHLYRDSILHVYTSREWWPCAVCVCVCPSASSRTAPFTVHAQPQRGTHGSCLEPLMTGLILKSHRVPPLPRFHSSCWSRTGKPNRPQNFHSERKKQNK